MSNKKNNTKVRKKKPGKISNTARRALAMRKEIRELLDDRQNAMVNVNQITWLNRIRAHFIRYILVSHAIEFETAREACSQEDWFQPSVAFNCLVEEERIDISKKLMCYVLNNNQNTYTLRNGDEIFLQLHQIYQMIEVFRKKKDLNKLKGEIDELELTVAQLTIMLQDYAVAIANIAMATDEVNDALKEYLIKANEDRYTPIQKEFDEWLTKFDINNPDMVASQKAKARYRAIEVAVEKVMTDQWEPVKEAWFKELGILQEETEEDKQETAPAESDESETKEEVEVAETKTATVEESAVDSALKAEEQAKEGM